jgi:hypothetical protein
MGTIEPDVSKWDPWRPEQVARLLSEVAAPWYVAGGWAMDLFLGEERRRHGDLEIGVPAERFDEVAAALADFELFVIGATWICRRDASIRLPYSQLVEWTEDGIPYGRPEVILLFKAKRSHEEKNQGDFTAALPRLDSERRSWLREAIARVHPGHPWVNALGSRAA